MAMQRWSMSPSHATLPGKFMRGKLRHSKSDQDIRLSTSNTHSATKPINVRKDTLKFDVGHARVPFQKEYNLVLLGQASVGKSGTIVSNSVACPTISSLQNIFLSIGKENNQFVKKCILRINKYS